MNKQDVINKIVAADDLNWSNEEGFTLLSMEEAHDMIQTCAGMSEEDTIKAVRWYESIRAGEVLLKNVLAGNIRIHHFRDNEPVFTKA